MGTVGAVEHSEVGSLIGSKVVGNGEVDFEGNWVVGVDCMVVGVDRTTAGFGSIDTFGGTGEREPLTDDDGVRRRR